LEDTFQLHNTFVDVINSKYVKSMAAGFGLLSSVCQPHIQTAFMLRSIQGV
jgi:hypothetical protein